MAEDRNETQAGLVQAEIQEDGAPQSPAAQPQAPHPLPAGGLFPAPFMRLSHPLPHLVCRAGPGFAPLLHAG